MSLKKIVLDGIEYLRADDVQKEPNGPTKIVVLQRGWVLVGHFERKGDQCTLKNASVIRNWGTTKGLGELAKEGPLSTTKLDKCNGLVEFEALTMVVSLSVDEEKWLRKL